MYNIVIYCNKTLSNLRTVLSGFSNVQCQVTVLMDIFPYMLPLDEFAIYLEELKKGTVFGNTVDFSYRNMKGSCILLSADESLSSEAIKYIDYFFEDGTCPLVFIPVLKNNPETNDKNDKNGKNKVEELPEELKNLPAGGIVSDFSLLFSYNFICATNNPSLFRTDGGFRSVTIQAALQVGRFGVLNLVSGMGKRSIYSSLSAMDLHRIRRVTPFENLIQEIINDYVRARISLPIDSTQEMGLLFSYLSPDFVEKRQHPAIQITQVSNYFEQVEIEGLFLPESEDCRLQIHADTEFNHIKSSRLYETNMDILLPRIFFQCRLDLTENYTSILFEQVRNQGHRIIEGSEIFTSDECATNYQLTVIDDNLEIVKTGARPYYKISCIIPIYNKERYLVQAVESILDQKLDFFANIQVILIDDGSTDSSPKICETLAEKYEENLVYKQQPHSGVSVARNVGLANAVGEYIIFLDADDTIDDMLLTHGIRQLDSNPNIDFISFPIKTFGMENPPAVDLDVRFLGNPLVNIQQEPHKVQFSACGVLMRASAIKGLEFNKNLQVAEDAAFMALAIKQQYRVCKEAFYNYRVSSGKYDNYRGTALLADALEKFSLEHYGEISLYVQHVILYDLRRCFAEMKPSNSYDSDIHGINHSLQIVSDDVIRNAPRFNVQQKEFLLRTKHSDNHINLRDNTVEIYIDYMRERKGFLCIAGYFELPNYDNILITAIYRDKKYHASLDIDERISVTVFGRMIHSARSFEIRIPLSEMLDKEVITLENDHTNETLNLNFPDNFLFMGNVALASPVDNGILIATVKQNKRATWLENMNITLVQEYVSMYPVHAQARIWLFVEPDFEGIEKSSTSHLYDYCKEKGINDIDYRLVSYDTDNHETDDKVIRYDSMTYNIMCLFAEKIIVSDIDELNRLKSQTLISAELIFLPNAILQSPLKALAGAPLQLISLSSKDEVKFIPAGKTKASTYMFGNPKFDSLMDKYQNDSTKRILFMPNFRHDLYIDEFNFHPKFKTSKYVKIISDLLQNKRILETAKYLGIGIDFAPHEKTYLQLSDFDFDRDVINVVPPAVSRLDLAKEADMVITDTLPVHGFSFLNKPVVYFQFAEPAITPQEFLIFGEKITDFNTLIDLLVEYMKSGFLLNPTYKKVSDNFFVHKDRSSCQRIYKRLLEG